MITGKLGRLPSPFDPHRLRMARRFNRAALPPIPATDFDWTVAVKGPLKMMGNDTNGDCTYAGLGHMALVLSSANGLPILIPDQTIVDAYYRFTGGADVGANMAEVLADWKANGVGGVKVDSWAPIRTTNAEQMRAAAYLFGGVYLGANLPMSLQAEPAIWDVPPGGPVGQGTPGSWGGHAYPSTGRGTGKHPVISWGAEEAETDDFEDAYVDEGYAVYCPQLWLRNGKTPHGYTDAEARYFLSAIGGPPAPPPPTTTVVDFNNVY